MAFTDGAKRSALNRLLAWQQWRGLARSAQERLQRRHALRFAKGLSCGRHTAVYAAEKRDGRRVAVKAFHMLGARELASELRALRVAGGHPNLPRLLSYDLEFKSNAAVLFLEPLGVCDLLAACDPGEARDAKVPASSVPGVVLGAARGLAHLHGLSLVHRDVKPENVVCVSDRGHYDGVLIDFNMTCAEGRISHPAGTIDYAAPEVADAMKMSYRLCVLPSQDSWGLGRVLEIVQQSQLVPPGGCCEAVRARLMAPVPLQRLAVATAVRWLEEGGGAAS